MLSEDGDDNVDAMFFPVFEAATKQGKGSRTGYIPWAICFCTIPRTKMDELVTHAENPYLGTLLTRKRTHLGPFHRPMPRVLGGSQGGGRFLMGEVTL